MRTIYKYNLTEGLQSLSLPEESRIVHVGEQHGWLTIWVEQPVQNTTPSTVRNINVYGTGQHVYDDAAVYVGTVLMTSGLVWHVYETK